jgi:hypothetical protein
MMKFYSYIEKKWNIPKLGTEQYNGVYVEHFVKPYNGHAGRIGML